MSALRAIIAYLSLASILVLTTLQVLYEKNDSLFLYSRCLVRSTALALCAEFSEHTAS